MIGNKMFDLCHELWPLNRSLSGNGVRETLKILQKEEVNGICINHNNVCDCRG